MSKTYRYHPGYGKHEETRMHSKYHRFDSHKLAVAVNHANYERHAHPVVLRTGTRGK